MKTLLAVAVCLVAISSASLCFGQTELVNDNFDTGTNGTYLGPNWTGCGYYGGSYAELVYQNSQAGGAGYYTRDCAVYTGHGAFPSDQYATATVVAPNPSGVAQAGVQLRQSVTPSAPESYIACGWNAQDFPADHHYRIWSHAPGASGPASLWLTNITPATNDVVWCQVLGITVTMKVNGTTIAAVTDTSGLTSGYPGLYYVDPNGVAPASNDVIWDTFAAGAGPALVSLTITPSSATAMAGSYVQFTGIAVYADGTTANINNWSSSNTSVATIDTTGFAYAANPGTVTITGATGPDSGTASLTVVAAQGYTPLVNDSFAGPTGSYLGSNWTGCGYYLGAYTELVYQDNQAGGHQNDDAGGGGYNSQECSVYTGYGAFPSDQYATATLVAPTPSSITQAGIQLRQNAIPSSPEFYIACGWNGQDFPADSHYRIWSLSPGAPGPVSLWLSSITPVTNDVIWCQVAGTAVIMRLNGTIIATVTDTSGVTNGYPGLYYVDPNAGAPASDDIIWARFVAGRIGNENGNLTLQTITFTTNAPASAAYNSMFTVAATGGGSGNAVTFTSSGACTNSGATYTMTSGTGTCTVIANQAGNASYTAAPQVTQTVNAALATQAITFTTNAPASAAYNSMFTVAATGGGSGNAVTFTSSGVCTNSGATYTMTSGTGTCTVIANQAGNTNYAAASQVTQTVNAALASQTITFTTNAPASAANNSMFTVATTGGGSGNAVTFTSSGVCTNSGATYTMTSGTGTCSVIANQAGNTNYAAAPQVTQTVNAALASQTITFTTNAPASAANNSMFTVAATGGGSGNAVTFTSSGVCTNSGATYTMTSGTGTCSVIANQAGNTNYAAAPQVTQTVNAVLATQAITFTTNAPASATYNTMFTVAATGGGSGNAVTFTSSGACTNSAATYTMTSGTGTCSVIANQAGNASYGAAPQVTQTVNAALATQAITFTTNAPASTAYNSMFTVAATGGGSGNAVTFTSSGVCTNSGATYTMTGGTGTCSVIANQTGNANYAAAPQVTQTANAALATQTITFTTNAPASAANNSMFTVAASASSGLTVAYTSAGVCTNSGAAYTMTGGTGTCSVIANQAGNTNYAAAPQVTQTVNAALASQTITFTTNAPASAANNSMFTVAATGGGSGNAVTFTSSGVCTNSGATYTMTSGTGTCSVIANQAGNTNYAAAPQVTQTVNAALASQTITFTTNAPASAANNSMFTVAASASSGLMVAYTSAGVCTNSGATYTMTGGTGTCSVIANQAGNASFAAAPQVTQTVNAALASQTITFTTNAPANAANNSMFTVAASASSGLTVAYTSAGVCTNSGATYTMTSGTGTCSVIANQAGNTNYAAAPQVTQTVNAALASQTITFTTNAPASAANNSMFTVAASASSGLTVTYTSTGACTNSGATYTMTGGTGTCSVIANQAGNTNYAAAPQVTQTVNAALASQTITFTTNAPASAAKNSMFTVAASASSGLTVAYTSAGVCTNSGATYTMTSGTGTCSVIANQAGNTNYAAAPQVTQTVNAALASQTITFTTNAPANAAKNSMFTVAASASSGLTVAYTSAGACTNSGATYTMTSGTGTCSVIANQAGDTNYAAAPQVTQTVNTAPASQTITFPAIPTQNGPGTVTLAATASSGLTVSYSVTSGPATVSGNILTTTGSGSVTVQATQAGNANYSAAAPVSQTFTVNPNASGLNGKNCNGTYTGTYNGNLTVSAGQNCIFTNGGVNGDLTEKGGSVVLSNNSFVKGNLQVNGGSITISNSALTNGGITGNLTQTGGTVVLSNNTFVTGNVQTNGGSLTVSNSSVGNDLQISGASSFSIGPGASIAGNLQIQSLPASGGINQVCGASITHNLTFQNSGTALLIGSAGGCAGNSVGGDFTVQSNTAATTIDYNTIGGNLTDQNNTAATQVFTNAVTKTLQCKSNSSISGGGNTASSKQGQCATF